MKAQKAIIRSERTPSSIPRYFHSMDYTNGAMNTIYPSQRAYAVKFESKRKANKQAKVLRERFPSFRFVIEKF